MPWFAQPSDECPQEKPWGIFKEDSGELIGCTESEESANQAIRAMYAAEEDQGHQGEMGADITGEMPKKMMQGGMMGGRGGMGSMGSGGRSMMGRKRQMGM